MIFYNIFSPSDLGFENSVKISLNINIFTQLTMSNYSYNRVFSKARNNWSAVPKTVPKEYSYMQGLVSEVVREISEGLVILREKAGLSMDDPRRIAATIAPNTPPPTAELVEKKVSRFQPSTSSH